MPPLTRELKLALIVGFSLVLVVTVLISDHLSKARTASLALEPVQEPAIPQIPFRELAPSKPEVEVKTVSNVAAGNAGTIKSPPPVEFVQRTGSTMPPVSPPAGRGDAATGADKQLAGADASAPERTHVVASGDTWYKIAKTYYNDSMAWKKLMAYNGMKADTPLKLDTKLKIPPAEVLLGKPSPVKLAGGTGPFEGVALNDAPPQIKLDAAQSKSEGKPDAKAARNGKAKGTTYTVKQGDSLASISRRLLGSPARVSDILAANPDLGDDETSLQIGTVLKIPASNN